MDTKTVKEERKELFERLKAARLSRRPEDTIKVTRVKQVKKKDRYVTVETEVESSQEEEHLLSRLFFLDIIAKRERFKKRG